MDPYANRYPPNWYQTPYNPHVYLPPQYGDPYQNQNQNHQAGWHAFFDRTRSKYPNLNPALAADMTHVRYDLRKPPRDGIMLTTFQQIALSPAVMQSTYDFRIISKQFPWTVDIRAPAGSVVTCSAVFEAIYAMLQEPMADSEWGIAVHEKSKKDAIEKAAKARQEKEKDKRLKRIDWLGDTTAFKGLERDEEFEKKRLLPGTSAVVETWVVKFAKP
ncbi:hypothetical protein HYDPIDRAFT_99460 [Hydnomerulius pinastri MD-312]|uniref:DUF6699 domain-containing protein n=1 Tax=Hydnomerulius pinastri MD-312 TaxID=994086 RepID=A0A0C9W240_9AGAM|nr:hypothetical protein HYDPIDRAFT_99460 [Hydnomerulius pinastri MD-312]